MASAELFNLTQPNQKQFSDNNNTMELSLTDLKLKFDGLDGLNGLNEGKEDVGDSSSGSSSSSSHNGDNVTTSNGGVAAAMEAATAINNQALTTTTATTLSCTTNVNSTDATAVDHSGLDRNEALAAEMVASALSMETAFEAMFPTISLGMNGGGSNSISNIIDEPLHLLLAASSMKNTTEQRRDIAEDEPTNTANNTNRSSIALMSGSSDESGLEMDASGGTTKDGDDDSAESAQSNRSPLSMLRLHDGFGGAGVEAAHNELLLLSGLIGGDDDEHNSATSGSSRSGSIGLGSSLLSGSSSSGNPANSGGDGLLTSSAAVGVGIGCGSGVGNNNSSIEMDNLMGGALEGDSHSLGSGGCGSGVGFGSDGEQECKICKSALEMPRVLACLHVVCEGCLETLLLDETGDTRNCSVACPVCKQLTTIDSRGAAGLHLDYTITNTVDLNTVEPHALACTSCKSKEQAMSRCNDCANFLCASCDNAHKYMRCFESHTVVLLADLRSSAEPVVIHKPLFCAVHTSELLKYYCFSCQAVACNDCLVAIHKGAEHRCDLIADAEPSVRADLEDVVAGARGQIAYCDNAAGQLSNVLTELQQQHDSAAERIERTYERCAAVLQRCRELARGDLERRHAQRELHVMDAMHGVEQSVERIETTCGFARKVLQRGNGAELLSLQPLITRQVHAVVEAMPHVDNGAGDLCFEDGADGMERFEALAQEAFGGFGGQQQQRKAVKLMTASVNDMPTTATIATTSTALNERKEHTPPPTLPGVLPMLAKSGGLGLMGSASIGCGNSAQNTMTSSSGSGGGSHSASSPISMPTSSMQSSFDGDLLGTSFLLSSNNGSGATAGNGGISSEDSQQQQQQIQQRLHHGQNMNHLQNQQQQQQHQQHISNVELLKREQQHQQQLNCNPLLSAAAAVHSPLGGGNGANSLVNVLAAANNALTGGNNVVVNGLVSALNGVVNGGNTLSNALNGIGSVGNALVNGLNGAGASSVSMPSTNSLNNMAGLSSIAEYNLHRLANLVESGASLTSDHHHQQQQQQQLIGQQQQQNHHHHLQQHHHHQQQQQHHHNISDDTTVATLNSNNQNTTAAVNNNNMGGGTAYTLTDMMNGDQRAFNQNLHALAKLNMNGGVGSALSSIVGAGGVVGGNGGVLNRGASPSIGNDNGSASLLSDFIGMPGNTSPIGTIASSIGDDLGGGGGSASGLSSLTAAMNLAGRTKATPMQIRCKFGSLGASKAQFNSPHGFCLGVEEEIIVADTNNHRIQVFEKIGTFKFQFGVPGKEEGQLWYPRKVAVMRTSGKFVVCDRGNERSRMQIFTKNGHFIKKIAIRYIDIVAGLAVTNQGHIVAVDSVSPTVFIIAEDGNLVHWFDCSDYMREPSDIAISGTDFYVCDFKGHNVAVFSENGTFLHRIGDEKITCFPNGIDISDAGDILIGDSHGNRFHVACFSRDGVLQSEFECPYVKVSRCCGLKITSEGYVVTLAKNNHHVLVLNTLYIH